MRMRFILLSCLTVFVLAQPGMAQAKNNPWGIRAKAPLSQEVKQSLDAAAQVDTRTLVKTAKQAARTNPAQTNAIAKYTKKISKGDIFTMNGRADGLTPRLTSRYKPNSVWGAAPKDPLPPPGFKTWTRPKQIEVSDAVKARLDAAATQSDAALAEAVKAEVSRHPEMADAIVSHAEAIAANATVPAIGPGVFAVAASSVSGVTAATTVAATAGAVGLAGVAIADGDSDELAGNNGGGGGGGGGGGPGGDDSFVVDVEFTQSTGLGQINADEIYGTTTGNDVIVAVMDSGLDIDHGEFDGKIATGGYDYVEDSAVEADMTDGDGHGTHVTGTLLAARDGIGMHGVAYNANVIPLRVFDDDGDPVTEPEFSAAVDRAVANNAEVINNSWGTDGLSIVDVSKAFIEAIDPNLVPSWQAAAAADVVNVFAAGNDGLTDVSIEAGAPLYFTDLQDHWIAVVSVDAVNGISAFSNACGVALNWCIAAPGENINSSIPYDIATETRGFDGYGTLSGTSMATPHVSGAVALLLDTFLGLTPEQAVDILFASATDLGDAGVDAVYGHGLLDLETALGALGTTTLPVGTTVSSTTVNTGSSRISGSAAFGDGLTRGLMHKKVVVLDGYQRAFTRNLGGFTKPNQDRFRSEDAFFAFGARQPEVKRLTRAVSLAYAQTQNDPRLVSRAGQDNDAAGVSRLALTTDYNQARVSVLYNQTPTQAFSTQTTPTRDLVMSDALANPHLALFDREDSAGVVAELPDTQFGTLRTASFYGGIESNNENRQAFAGIAEVELPPAGPLTLRLNGGSLVENESLLGASGDGAFAMGRSTTVFGGAQIETALSQRTRLLTGYSYGVSKMDKAANSLIQSARNVTSGGFSLGLVHDSAFKTNDQLGFSISQPLRVTSGQAQMVLPTSRDAAGNIGYTSESTDLTPTGRELALQGWYATAFGTGTELNIGAAFRHQPGHIKDADPEALGMIRVRQPLN